MIRTLQVGPFTYTVKQDVCAVAKLDSELGTCDPDELTITITPTAPERVQQECLVHEALHAMTALTGLAHELGEEVDERVVRRLAPVLLEVLSRNPRFVEYLSR